MIGVSPSTVSVIIPFYNAAQHIESCVDSVRGQDYSNIEIVLVDDGSTDRSGELADSFAERDKRITVLHRENGGVSKARNAGCMAATGSILMFLDSDDELEASAVSRIASTFRDFDIVVYGWKVVRLDGSVIREMLPPENNPDNVNDHIRKCLRLGLNEYAFSYAFSAKMLLDSGFQKGLFVEGCGLFEDVWSVHRLLRKGQFRIAYLHEAVYRYRQIDGSATRRHDPELAKQGLNAIRALNEMAVPSDCEDRWHAKLLMLALGSADWAAGPGIGDGQRHLHKEIDREIRLQLSAGAYRGLQRADRVKLALHFVGCYRPLRRLRSFFSKTAARLQGLI